MITNKYKNYWKYHYRTSESQTQEETLELARLEETSAKDAKMTSYDKISREKMLEIRGEVHLQIQQLGREIPRDDYTLENLGRNITVAEQITQYEIDNNLLSSLKPENHTVTRQQLKDNYNLPSFDRKPTMTENITEQGDLSQYLTKATRAKHTPTKNNTNDGLDEAMRSYSTETAQHEGEKQEIVQLLTPLKPKAKLRYRLSGLFSRNQSN